MSVKAIDHLHRSDPVTAGIIDLVDLPDLPVSQGVYHDVVSCIVDHQIPSRSRGVYLKKLIGLLGGKAPDDNNIYTIQEDDWRAQKMAYPKYLTLFRFTDAWHEQGMKTQDWDGMTDDEIREQLTAIKGIGPNTADLVLLYSLGRPDVFPMNDSHIKQVIETLYLEEGDKLKATMQTVSTRWAPHRSLATRYLLGYREQRKLKK